MSTGGRTVGGGELFDANVYHRIDSPWGSGPMPLWMFPQKERDEFDRLCALPSPPPRWMDVGPGVQIESRAWFEWHWRRGRDPEGVRPTLPKWLRSAVIERDGYICQLCGGAVEPNDVHIDHILPFSRGGPDTLSNLQVAHSFCNISKGARV